MQSNFFTTRMVSGLAPLLLPLFMTTACADRDPAPTAPVLPPSRETTVGTLLCRASVAAGTVTCDPAPTPGKGGAANALEPRFARHMVGEQGYYVRLESSSVAYNGGIFAFDVIVRNQSNMWMGTAGDAVGNHDGLRVFFINEPVATEGSGNITIANATGRGTFTQSNQAYYDYSWNLAGPAGILFPKATSAPVRWEFQVPASVTAFEFLVAVDARDARWRDGHHRSADHRH